MSDDEDTYDAVSPQQQIAPLPSVPPNQGPISIPLSVLLDFAVQKVYQELTIKTQLLPNMSDLDRKVDIMQFAHKTRQLFVRLLAIVKWAKSAGKVDVCTAISCFLSQQSSYFVETADSLYQLSRENLSDARLPVFQIPAAVEVMTLGTYSRLPLSLRTRFVPDDPIKSKEQACVLQRLNQIIIYKLIYQSQNLPVKYRVKNGVVTFRVENEFESSLTLLGETADLPWTLLNLKILVEDYDIGEGTDLVHPQQVHYLHQVVQARIEASSTPIVEMFNILHSFCLSLRLDILFCQMSKLIYERLNDNVSIGEYRSGQKLVIHYWKNIGGNLPIKTQAQSSAFIQYKIIIDIVTTPNDRKTLRITHIPSSNADLPMMKDYEGEIECDELDYESKIDDCDRRILNMENLLTDTQLKRVKDNLGQVKDRLARLLNKTTCDDCCQLMEKDALSPSLNVNLIDSSSDEDILSITINLFSGRYMSDCVKLRYTNLLEGLSQALNTNSWNSLEQYVKEMRLTLFVEQCKVSISNAAAKLCDYPAVAISALSYKPLPKHRILLKFPRYENYLLVTAFDIEESINMIVTRFYLTNFVYDDSSASGTCCMMKIVNMTELNDFDRISIDYEPLKKRRKVMNGSGTPEDVAARIGKLLSTCEQKIPFILLCDYFTKKGVKFHLIHDEPEVGYSSLRIVGFHVYPEVDNAKLLMSKLFSNVISCTVRLLLDKNRFQWNFEFHFNDVPFQKESGIINMASMKSKELNNVQEKFTRIASRNWPILQQLADGGAAKCVEEFLAVAYCYSKMDDLARKFRLVYQNHYIRQYAVVKSFTYHKIVLAYGPSMNYLAAVEYRFMDKCYNLSLGVTDRTGRQSFDDPAVINKTGCKLCNPNSVIAFFLQQILNRRGNLAQVVQILIETWPILAALQQLPHVVTPLNADFLPLSCTQLPQQALQQSPVGGPYSYLFQLVPISATVYRLMFRWTYCLEIVCLSQSKLALKDSKSCNSTVNAKHASKLLPIGGLKSFISMYDKSLSVLDSSPKSKKNILLHGKLVATNETTKSSPAKASSTSDLKLFSPSDGTMIATPSPAAAAIAPSPAAATVTHSSQGHLGYHSTLSPANPFSQGSVQGVPASPAAPPSNAGLFSPSPAPLSNACMLMTPSPAGVGGPNSNFPQPSPAAPSSIGPSTVTSAPTGGQFYQQQPSSVPTQVHSPPPMTTSVPSPCSVLNEFAALSSDNKLPGSVEYPSSWGDLSGPPSAATPGEKDSTLRSSGVSLSTPTNPSVTMLSTLVSSRNVGQTPVKHSQSLDLSSYAKPIIIKHSTLAELCQKETNNNESNCLAPITKFLSTMALFERLCRFDRPNQSMDIGQSNTSGTVVLKYLPFEYKFYIDDSTLSDIRLRVNELNNENKFTMDDLRSVEQYFSQFVAPMYNFNAIQSLLRLLMLSHKAHSSMLKSVLCLMKHQLNPHPEQGMMWRPSLCLLTPPFNMMIPPFVPALNSQLVLQPGSHAIIASQPGNKVLFWLKLTNVSNPENQVIFPLRYDGDSNEIQVFIANPALFAQQQQANSLQFVLINNVNNILKRQITAYQAVNECCMWPAIRDLSKNLELPSS